MKRLLYSLLSVAILLACFAFLPAKKPKSTCSVVTAQETTEGAGARVKRLFRTSSMKHLDPFVMMDEFFVEPPAGFPTHSHRGFEAITYMLDGEFRHTDNLGNNSEVAAGGAQRFTAGKGIMHSEMPGKTATSHGIQLWINLPKSKKQMEPGYQQVNPSEIPVEKGNGVTTRYIVGRKSPLVLQTEMDYRDIQLEAKVTHILKPDESFVGYVYIISGDLLINKKETLTAGMGYVFKEQTSPIKIEALKSTRLIFVSGRPHYEPIKQRGPFVD